MVLLHRESDDDLGPKEIEALMEINRKLMEINARLKRMVAFTQQQTTTIARANDDIEMRLNNLEKLYKPSVPKFEVKDESPKLTTTEEEAKVVVQNDSSENTDEFSMEPSAFKVVDIEVSDINLLTTWFADKVRKALRSTEIFCTPSVCQNDKMILCRSPAIHIQILSICEISTVGMLSYNIFGESLMMLEVNKPPPLPPDIMLHMKTLGYNGGLLITDLFQRDCELFTVSNWPPNYDIYIQWNLVVWSSYLDFWKNTYVIKIHGTLFGYSIHELWLNISTLGRLLRICLHLDVYDTLRMIKGINMQLGKGHGALDLFYQLGETEVLPDMSVISSVLSACSALNFFEGGEQIHCYGIRSGLDSDPSIDLYTKCRRANKGRRIFDQMAVENLVSWTTMISGYVRNSFDIEAMKLLFSDMVKLSWKPDTFACSSVLISCASVKAINLGRQIHAYSFKINLEKDEIVTNGLIDMYSKCDSLSDTRRVFDTIQRHNTFSYGAMIDGNSELGVYVGENTHMKLNKSMHWLGRHEGLRVIKGNNMRRWTSNNAYQNSELSYAVEIVGETLQVQPNCGIIVKLCANAQFSTANYTTEIFILQMGGKIINLLDSVDGALSKANINYDFQNYPLGWFSAPRPPESTDLEDKVILRVEE